MLSCAGGFLPTGTAKIVHFFTINAHKGIYFFIYNVVCDTAL